MDLAKDPDASGSLATSTTPKSGMDEALASCANKRLQTRTRENHACDGDGQSDRKLGGLANCRIDPIRLVPEKPTGSGHWNSLMQAIAIHFIVKCSDADAESAGGFFAVKVVCGEGILNGQFLGCFDCVCERNGC